MSDCQADAHQWLTAFLEGLQRLPRGGASRDPQVATADFMTPGVYAIFSQTGREPSRFSATANQPKSMSGVVSAVGHEEAGIRRSQYLSRPLGCQSGKCEHPRTRHAADHRALVVLVR